MSVLESESLTTGGGNPDQDEDAVWQELAAARDGTTSTEAAPETPAPVQAPATDSGAGSDDEAARNTDAAAQAPAPKASGDDPWEGVPPEVAERLKPLFDKQEHTIRSVTGRLSAADRRLAELSRPPSGGATDGGSGGSPRKSAKQLLETDEAKAALSEYEPVLSPIMPVLNHLLSEVERLGGTADSVEQDRAVHYVRQQETALTDAFPDWQTVCSSDEFAAWVNDHPSDFVRKTVLETNGAHITSAADGITVLQLFRADHASAPAATAQPSGEVSRRDRQKAGAPRGGGISAPATGTDPEDPEALWNSLAVQRERKAQR